MKNPQKGEQHLAQAEEITIKKESAGKFQIIVRGEEPDGGWTVNLYPVHYIQEPDDWEIEALATSTVQIHNHMVTPWTASITMGLGSKTKSITVKGRGAPITKKVPS